MGLFDFFRKDKNQRQEETLPAEKYWLLAGGEGELMEPDWPQVEQAVKTAADGSAGGFICLSCLCPGLEIASLQAVGEDGLYRLEALPPEGCGDYGKIYDNAGDLYADVLAFVN